MATLTSSPLTVSTPKKTVSTARPKGEALHHALLWFGIALAAALIQYVAITGASGQTVGSDLGILSFGMFVILFLYALGKRSKRLSAMGSTNRWLNFRSRTGPCLCVTGLEWSKGGMQP